MTDLFKDKSPEFKKANEVTIKNANLVGKYLITWELPSIPIMVNMLTPFLKKTNSQFQNNSNFIIDEMGMGKTSIVTILQQSNPEYIKILPKKMYAMNLLDLGNEFYKNSVLIHQDMIGAFSGLSQKTFEQLSGFWTSILSEHSYQQLGKEIKDANCSVMFPITKIGWFKAKKLFFDETLIDRVTQLIVKPRDEDEKKEITDFKINREEIDMVKFPKIKLPFSKKHKIIKYDRTLTKEIINLSHELDEFKVCSITRGSGYIRNFLKANAMLNDRNKINIHDLEMYKLVHSLHKGTHLSMLQKVRYALSTQGKMSDTDLIQKNDFTRPTFYKYKKQLENTF